MFCKQYCFLFFLFFLQSNQALPKLKPFFLPKTWVGLRGRCHVWTRKNISPKCLKTHGCQSQLGMGAASVRPGGGRNHDGEKMDVIITLIGAEGGGHEQSMKRISCAAPRSAVSSLSLCASPPALLRSHCCICQRAKKMCKSRGFAALALAQG